MGLLDLATGINDKNTQEAIKTFQEKAGLVVDGMVGDDTLSKLLLGESAYLSSRNTTLPFTATTTTSGLDTEPPVWDKDSLPYASEIGSLFNLNIPLVTDNVGIVSYEIYVNGALSTYVTITDTRLLVTPKYDIACADQYVYVVAFDEAGNSSQSQTFIIPQSDPCISVISANESTSESSSESTSQTYFAVTFGGVSNDKAYNIAVDSSGNTYITGYFQSTVDFGGGDITSAGAGDIFVLKLNSSGVFQWVKTYGGTSNEYGYDIALDSSGNTYITGTFLGTVDFGGGNITAAVLIDTFVIKTNSSGVFQWVKTYGGSASEFGYRIAVDSSDNVYITGHFTGTLDFGGGNVTSVGNEDIFVLKLNSSGEFQWINNYGDTLSDWGYGLAVDSSSNVYITGYFIGTVDFGGGDITSAGAGDIVVFKTNSSGGGIE